MSPIKIASALVVGAAAGAYWMHVRMMREAAAVASVPAPPPVTPPQEPDQLADALGGIVALIESATTPPPVTPRPLTAGQLAG